MDTKEIVKKVFPTLLVTLYTIPAIAGTVDQLVLGRATNQEKPKAVTAQEAVRQELVQVLRNGESSTITMNVAGQPGTFFKIMASPSGAEKSYIPAPKGEGVIGKNGMGSVSFDLKGLAKDEVYIKVITSDEANFSSTRYTPKPLILAVDPVLLSWNVKKKYEQEINKLKEKADKKMNNQNTRTPSAVAGIRG